MEEGTGLLYNIRRTMGFIYFNQKVQSKTGIKLLLLQTDKTHTQKDNSPAIIPQDCTV